MAKQTHPIQECQHEGSMHGWNAGGRGVDRLSFEGEDPGETWFRMEHSSEEARTLKHLEGELISTLMFEHGGRQLASSLWVVRILLGHLFHERLALGWMVEAFAKNYQRESMRSLAKLQDLVDLAKSPLGGVPATTSSGQTKDEAMELDEEEEEEHKDDTPVGKGSLGEDNLSLG